MKTFIISLNKSESLRRSMLNSMKVGLTVGMLVLSLTLQLRTNGQKVCRMFIFLQYASPCFSFATHVSISNTQWTPPQYYRLFRLKQFASCRKYSTLNLLMKIREFSHHIINVWIISDGVTGHLIPSYSWLTHITLKKSMAPYAK